MTERRECEVTAETNVEKSVIYGRNGTARIQKIKFWTVYGDLVHIDGIGVKGRSIKGGLTLNVEALDEICRKWLETRGKVVTDG